MTADQYATYAEDYEEVKSIPWVRHLETFTFLDAMGDVRGKTILDVACGSGYYTRLLRRNGASEVVGVDVSEAMIDAARRQEAAEPLGVTYHVHDVSDMPRLGDFDLAVSAYLLNYAPSEAALTAMCQRILDNLAENGTFVYFGMNPSFSHEEYDPAKFNKYELLEITSTRPIADGLELTVSFLVEPITLVVYHLPKPTYERALARAGFTTVEWLPQKVSDEGIEEFGEEFWAEALNNPLCTAIRASR